jgi:hypothetical protein
MKNDPHPSYSPDLISSDFFLFEKVKRLIKDQMFQSADELLATIERILNDIEKSILVAVFQEWMRRLRFCTKTKGE